ncbi:delta-aminolevulinic acid dehydratase [Clostridium novyi A str. 4552]|uniref:Delta-aminolevulinic acid dehydratase n=1 Tax=Clostridium novyi A str. 4552 TaxID=1444289 RepID=A0A0A0I323_CLONO|nr:porphobilinogen synthase [Clostridium novyi]KGM94701.1 delta-aminolevulinic acid dehydratase [Clostridium novyi A str. 4552]
MNILKRPRRLRANTVIRDLVRETTLSTDDFVYPLFVVEGNNIKKEISSLKGQYQLSVDMLEGEIKELISLGIKSVILFGIPDVKDEVGCGAYDDNGIVQKATREIKSKFKDMYVITDLCMCEYTSHGHCGILDEDGYVNNDKTLEYLSKIAVSQAKAGADMIAPSDMMDGRVAAIREALDKEGFCNIPIMAYSAKYASAFYGPFRDAADSAPSFGDRKSYQMDPANVNEGLREVALDIEEGADIVMVKPALPYLDVLRKVKDNFNMPIAAYNVSGEYAMVRNAVDAGLLNESAILESLISIKRAGADIIITYFAKDAAKMLRR